jgi:hypothetical protein
VSHSGFATPRAERALTAPIQDSAIREHEGILESRTSFGRSRVAQRHEDVRQLLEVERLLQPGRDRVVVERLGAAGHRDDGDVRERRLVAQGREELRDVTPALALKAAGDKIRSGREVVVVAGDATVIGPMLSHFGEVKVVDPTKNFERVRTIPKNEAAPLEVERQEGK